MRTAAVHRFRARTRGHVSATRNVSIEANARHVVVELVLEPATFVTGRVVDDAGARAMFEAEFAAYSAAGAAGLSPF